MPRDPLRTPFLSNQPDVVDPDVQVALDSLVLWLCKAGKPERIYLNFPCFNTRSRALHELCLHEVASRFKDRGEVNFVCHCHEEAISLVLQVNPVKGQYMPAADAVIPMSARRLLDRDGALDLKPYPTARTDLQFEDRAAVRAAPKRPEPRRK